MFLSSSAGEDFVMCAAKQGLRGRCERLVDRTGFRWKDDGLHTMSMPVC